jgi:hypothetical protein
MLLLFQGGGGGGPADPECGCRSMLAFWMGGACAGAEPEPPEPPVVTPPDAGGRIVGGTFSRKKWREVKEKWRLELLEAWEAQERVENAARELKAKTKRKLELAKAAQLAEQALLEAEVDKVIEGARLRQLALALEGAASARKSSEAVAAAQRAITLARAIIRELEDEEDTILLLSSL